MLEEEAIFTLWGSKPMTLIILDHHDETEYLVWYEKFSEEEKQNCRIIETYDLPENWEKWSKISHKFPMKNYLLVKRKLSDDDSISYVYFVDIGQTTSMMQKHYSTFKQILGFDFDPIEVVYDIQNNNSRFWTSVEQSSLLMGFLFGYGELNATAFHLKSREKLENSIEFLEPRPSRKSLVGKVGISTENFPIPAFMSFDEPDAVIEQYQKEREAIRAKYAGKDFLNLTLERLMH